MTGGDGHGVDRSAGRAGEVITLSRPSLLVWPMIGSTALRRRNSRLVVGDVIPRL